MQDQVNATPTLITVALEQGQADRGEAAATTQARLVGLDVSDRRPRSRPNHVQSGDRQHSNLAHERPLCATSGHWPAAFCAIS
jgi:hypothetical protein